MPDTGYHTGTLSPVTGTWTNFSASVLGISDNNRATTNSTTVITGTLSTFFFDVPPGATIDNIEVPVEFSPAQPSQNTGTIRISMSWDNGTSWSDTQAQFAAGSSTDTIKFYSGTWGRTWSPSDFDNGNFLLKVAGQSTSGGGHQVRLDSVVVRVFYTEGAGGWANIGKINRVTATTFGKVNRVPVAEIGKINRVPT